MLYLSHYDLTFGNERFKPTFIPHKIIKQEHDEHNKWLWPTHTLIHDITTKPNQWYPSYTVIINFYWACQHLPTAAISWTLQLRTRMLYLSHYDLTFGNERFKPTFIPHKIIKQEHDEHNKWLWPTHTLIHDITTKYPKSADPWGLLICNLFSWNTSHSHDNLRPIPTVCKLLKKS
jgi:hypothetical protein